MNDLFSSLDFDKEILTEYMVCDYHMEDICDSLKFILNLFIFTLVCFLPVFYLLFLQ